MNTSITELVTTLALLGIISSASAALPDPGMEIVKGRTALVITDPQNDFLSPEGATWGVVGNATSRVTTCLPRV